MIREAKRQPDAQAAQEWLDDIYEEIERRGGSRDSRDGWYGYGYWKGLTDRALDGILPGDPRWIEAYEMGFADGVGDRPKDEDQ